MSHYNMGADASKQGYGATFKTFWIQERYPQHWQTIFAEKEIGISVLELYPILVLMGTFGRHIPNSSVLFHSDNQGVVDIVNKQSSPSPIIMNIVRPLVLLLMEFNINLQYQHLEGTKNILCDLISRFQVTAGLLHEHHMDPEPTRIPAHLKSSNFKLK